MANNAQIQTEIQKSYRIKKRLIPFVGAGFSRNIDSFPTWDDFVQILKVDLNLDPAKTRAFDMLPNNLEMTEFYIREMGKRATRISDPSSRDDYRMIFESGRQALVKKIERIFDENIHPFDPVKWSTHLLLLEKFNKIIYTTNWDNTLERAAINTYCGHINPKTNYAFSKEIEDGKPRVIKYHGDYQTNGDKLLVSCLTDYLKRMTSNNCLDIKLESDLLRYDFLLLGYSFSDPNIHLMIHHLGEIITTTNNIVGGNHINTSIYMVALEKPDDLRVNLLKDTFYSLKPYYLLEPCDYDGSGNPIGSHVKAKTEDFLRSLI